MADIKFLTENAGDAATLTGGSWQATLPLPNLQQKLLALVARSTNALVTSTRFDIDLGSATKVVRGIGFVRHNGSQDGTVTITAGTTPGGTDKYSGPAVALWPVVYDYQDLPYGHPNWWNGKLSAAEALLYPMKFIHDVGSNILARYWRVQITDTANAAGYFQLARLFLGPIWSPEFNYSYGASVRWESTTREERSLGGALYFDERTPLRVFDFSVDMIADSFAYGRWLDLQRTHGISDEMLVIPDAGDTTRRHRRDIWGRARKFDPITNFSLGLHRTGVTIEEII